MTNPARPLRFPSSSRARRAHLLPLAVLLVALVGMLLAAPAADAVVSKVGLVETGVAPRISPAYIETLHPSSYRNPQGHPVLHSENTYLIYWDPTDHYHGDWQETIDHYMQNAGLASGSLETTFAVAQQYTDLSDNPASYHQVFHGAYVDYTAYPSSGCTDPAPLEVGDRIGPEVAGKHTAVCLTSTQLAGQVESFVASHSLPRGLENNYFVLLPDGVAVCLDSGGATGHCSDYVKGNSESYEHSFCSYHAAVNPGAPPAGSAETLVYAVIPWIGGGIEDPLLLEGDRSKPGWECQDGGINPAGKNGKQEVEKKKVKTTKEEEEFAKKGAKEKEEQEETEALEEPHAQEPNRPAVCPDVFDGGCDTGQADLMISQIGLQQINMITDPLLNAWQDSSHNENTDECRFVFGLVRGGGSAAEKETFAGTLYNQELGESGHYYLNDVFNLAALLLPYPGGGCLNHANFKPEFTAPNPVNSGEIVGFNGMESNIALNASIDYNAKGETQPNYATYTWDFGDGSAKVSGFAPGSPACEAPWLSPCAASVFHSYTYGGTYTVTVTVHDVGGDVRTSSHQVTVNGPLPPGPSGSGSGSGSSSSSSSSSSSTGSGSTSGGSSGAGSTPGMPSPVASAAVLTHTLRALTKSGVLVAYSVNEQVAGHFEVLLSRALAHKLHITGTPATGLPAGTAPSLVVAKALIITTAGGHSTIKLFFSKRNNERLAHQHSVAFLLRLIVHNAAPKPESATVLSRFTLTH